MDLTERIQEAARDPEGLRFDDFMDRVLYDEDHGYFATSADRAAREGDFLTAPETSADFAACLATHLAQAATDDPPAPYRILEVGAGRGTLARQLADALADGPLDPFELHLVERAARPRAAIADQVPDARLYPTIDDVPDDLDAHAFVANELFDNLPVRRVMQGDHLIEIRVRYVRNRFEEILVDAPDDLVDHFESQDVRLRAGQTAEACLEAPRLLERILRRLATPAQVVIIDYGDRADRLYAHDRFPSGTLACHRRHGTDRAYYEDLGQKDLTAHVNLTPLIDVLEGAGFHVDEPRTQAQFLIDNGLPDRMAATEADRHDPFERMRRLMRAKHLFHPDAMGESFRVLTARRGRP